MTFGCVSQLLISLFVFFSFIPHYLHHSVTFKYSNCIKQVCGALLRMPWPVSREWAVKLRMLNQPLLTSISALQDEAPVSPGFVVFPLYTLLPLLHTLPFPLFIMTPLLMASPLWQCRSIALSPQSAWVLPQFFSSLHICAPPHHPCCKGVRAFWDWKNKSASLVAL